MNREINSANRATGLQSAALIVEAVLAQLDRTTTSCGECSATRWNNRDEYQMGIELEAMAQKLRKFAAKLGIDPNADPEQAESKAVAAIRLIMDRLESKPPEEWAYDDMPWDAMEEVLRGTKPKTGLPEAR